MTFIGLLLIFRYRQRNSGDTMKQTRKAESKRRADAQAAIVASHRSEIDAMREGGKKPSEIAAWLNQFGFAGTGATLNGILPWRPEAGQQPLTAGNGAVERKKVGRPRKHKDAAARVRAFRDKTVSPGHRYDIYLGEEATNMVRTLQGQSGLSASGVIDAVLRGALALSGTK